MTNLFSPEDYSIYEEVYGEHLSLRSSVGRIIPAPPEATLLHSHDQSITDSKYANAIRTIAFDPTSTAINSPCSKCGRQIVFYRFIGVDKKAYMSCRCGNSWIPKSQGN